MSKNQKFLNLYVMFSDLPAGWWGQNEHRNITQHKEKYDQSGRFIIIICKTQKTMIMYEFQTFWSFEIEFFLNYDLINLLN